MSQHGYSQKSLGIKLGIKEGFVVLLINSPWTLKVYAQHLGLVPDGVRIVKTTHGTVDIVHVFVTDFAQLQKELGGIQKYLKRDGSMWISWQKGTTIRREMIREYILANTDLVDIKVAAVDEEWSGLKFVYRLAKR